MSNIIFTGSVSIQMIVLDVLRNVIGKRGVTTMLAL
jgi:hypothetical protein